MFSACLLSCFSSMLFQRLPIPFPIYTSHPSLSTIIHIFMASLIDCFILKGHCIFHLKHLSLMSIFLLQQQVSIVNIIAHSLLLLLLFVCLSLTLRGYSFWFCSKPLFYLLSYSLLLLPPPSILSLTSSLSPCLIPIASSEGWISV